jgi:hypothetical protein
MMVCLLALRLSLMVGFFLVAVGFESLDSPTLNLSAESWGLERKVMTYM